MLPDGLRLRSKVLMGLMRLTPRRSVITFAVKPSCVVSVAHLVEPLGKGFEPHHALPNSNFTPREFEPGLSD